MIKKLLVLISILAIYNNILGSNLGSSKDASTYIDYKNIWLAIDGHDVAFERDYRIALQSFWQSKDKLLLLKRFIAYGLFRLKAKSPEDPRYCIEKFLENEDGSLPDKALDVINTFRPNQKVIAELKRQKELGLGLALFSNIGPRMWTDMQSKHPEVKDLFDIVVIPNKENNYVTKRSAKLAEELKTKALEKNPNSTEIIMLDDSQKKITIAENSNGNLPIHGWRYKNIDQFLKESQLKFAKTAGL